MESNMSVLLTVAKFARTSIFWSTFKQHGASVISTLSSSYDALFCENNFPYYYYYSNILVCLGTNQQKSPQNSIR